MLSRAAESIYWMARYVERAENVARFIGVNLHLMLAGFAGALLQCKALHFQHACYQGSFRCHEKPLTSSCEFAHAE